ncbi:MAG: acetyltransferase [Bdellovibrionia bacterium]
MKEQIILVGGGGHCHSCIDVIEAGGRFEIAGILDQIKEIGSNVLGYKVIGRDEKIAEYDPKRYLFLVTVGQIKGAMVRKALFDRIAEAKARMPVIVSPYAVVSKHAQIADGTVVMHGATVNSQATIGTNTIINSHSLIEHDTRVGSHCHIATGAIINGGSQVGDETFVGSGAIVKQGVTIGKRCLISFGSRVGKDIGDDEVFKS